MESAIDYDDEHRAAVDDKTLGKLKRQAQRGRAKLEAERMMGIDKTGPTDQHDDDSDMTDKIQDLAK